MRLAATILLLALVCVPVRGQDVSQAVVSRADIDAAIARAKGKEDAVELKPSRINISGTGFIVRVEGPSDRIESYARQQLKKYLPVTADSIPQALLASTLTIVASPLTQVTASGTHGDVVTSPATHAVLAIKDGSAERIIQPTSKETFDVEVTGMKTDNDIPRKMHTTKGIRASFPYAALPAGGFEIRIVTETKEYVYEIDEKKRAMVHD